MRIGVCTTDFPRMPLEELFSRIHDLGFSVVQLAFGSVVECECVPDGACEIPDGLPDGVAERIADCAARNGLEIVCVNGTYNMAHPDPAVREASAARFPGFMKAVRAIGCDSVTLCTGTRSAEYLWRTHPDNDSDEAWADMREMVRRAVDVAEVEGITLLVETEASNVVSSAERARRLMDEIGSPNLRVVMDCANLFHAGEARPERVRDVIGHAFDVLGADVRLAHGKDILAGDGLDFCGTGDGIVDFGYMLARLDEVGHRGDMVLHGIKCEAQMPAALAYMRRAIAKFTP